MSRSVRLICPLLLMLATTACFERPNEEADELLASLQSGDESIVCSLVYGCPKLSPSAQKTVVQALAPLRGHAKNPLLVSARRREEHLQMLIVRVPWQPAHSASAFQPVLTVRKSGTLQIVGFVLPFDDIVPLLNEQEMHEAVRLGVLWVEWMNSGGGALLSTSVP